MPSSLFASVYIDSPHALLDKPLTYEVPSGLRELVGVGSYVLVPLREERVTGYVISTLDTPDRPQAADDTASSAEAVKPILELLSEVPFFDQRQLRLARWISRYYHCPMVDALRCIAPGSCRQKHEKIYGIADPEGIASYLSSLSSRSATRRTILSALAGSPRPLTLTHLKKCVGNSRITVPLRKLVDEGWVSCETSVLDQGSKKKTVKAICLASDCAEGESPAVPTRELTEDERVIVDLLAGSDGIIPLKRLKELRLYNASTRRLLAEGVLQWSQVSVERTPAVMQLTTPKPLQLTEEQHQALVVILRSLQRICQPSAGRKEEQQEDVILVHGVTASGKTEVYLRAIEFCLQCGRQSLVLVPEISLTEQTLAIFRSRFGRQVAVFHSALSRGERYDEWNRVRLGQANIVLGARSAIFAPLSSVGLIVIDEEHDGSYKQDNSPRYHARDVAFRRAQLEHAVVVLGSATPSLESFLRAERGKSRLVTMTRRVGDRQLPAVEIVDLRKAKKDLKSLPILSPRLSEGIQERLDKGEQTILFLNRRGYSSVIHCPYCGHVEECVHCTVSLTFHQVSRLLRCHHCNSARPAPSVCSNCGAPVVGYLGIGTERVESEVALHFQEARLLRMDRDTTTRKGSHARLLDAFRNHEADILIGTQMIAKGLDFPRVTLVGVIVADTALFMPDFRAAERTFQLLAQVSGRAGRGDSAGTVMIQTYQPDHYAVVAAAGQDFDAFWKKEARIRRQLPYPPYTHLVNIVSLSPDAAEAQTRIREVQKSLEEVVIATGGTQILGPAPCPLSKVKDHYRWHLLLRDRSKPRLHQLLQQTFDQWPASRRLGLVIDVDPVSLM